MLTEDVTVVTEDVTVVTEDVAIVTEDVAVVTEDITVVTEDITVVTEDVTVVTEDVAEPSARFAGHKSHFAEPSARFAGHKSHFAGHKSYFAGNKSHFAEPSARFAGHKSRFAGHKSHFAGHKSHFARHKSHFAVSTERLAVGNTNLHTDNEAAPMNVARDAGGRYDREMSFDPALPAILAAANALSYDYKNGKGVDFEPYPEFQHSDATRSWIRAWTRNPDLDGQEYRVFGQDGTGGVAALWLVREGQALEAQPVVFFGSEGSVGVVARSLYDYLWVLAGGLGPLEAVESARQRAPIPEKVALAKQYAPNHQRPALEVIQLAREEFPDFERDVMARCR